MNMARRMVANPPENNITAATDFAHGWNLFLCRNHPALPGIIKNSAGVHDWAHVTERFEMINLAGGLDGDGRGVAGFQHVAEAFGDFARIEFAGGDAVAEEDARETFGEHELTVGGTQRDGCVFARAAAAEIFAADDNGIIAVELAFLDVADGVNRFGQAVEGVAAELLVFLGDGGHEVQKLRGDDLVGVNVVAHDIDGAGKNGLHNERNVSCANGIFNQISITGLSGGAGGGGRY